MNLKALENQVGLLEIMSFLYNHKKSYMNEIRIKTNINIITLYNALKRLNELELIREEPASQGFGRPKRWIFLTDKGKKVAVKLVEIEKIMKEK